MNSEKIIDFAKQEISTIEQIGFVELPQTRQIIIEMNEGIPLEVYGLINWSYRYKKTFRYLIVKAFSGTWKEIFQKFPL